MSITDTNKIRLSNYERETIFIFNEEEKTASIYTCSQSCMKKMNRLCAEFPELYRLKRQDEYSKTYEFPKKYIKIEKPRLSGARNNAANR